MCRMQKVLQLVALCVGLAHSWDLAISKGDLLEFYTNYTKTVTIRFESQKLAALAYDDVHNIMLYVDKQNGNDAICGYNISSMQYKCLTEKNGRNIRGLAFDPATELLFFTDTKERSINWISLKPESKNNVYGNVLIKMHDEIPTDIAVDSCRGYIYWINTNLATPTIERARFNGSEREVIINPNLVSINTTYKLEPHSLVIDQQTQKIFWIEYDATRSSVYHICNADLNGTNKKVLIDHDLVSRQAFDHTSNKLTDSKKSIFLLGWFSRCAVWEFPKNPTGTEKYNGLIKFGDEIPDGIASNYKTNDQIQGSQDCKALTNLRRNNSTESTGEFCVHGMKINGQSLCKCTLGYIGERCDVSICENYCIQGNCSFNDEGQPECSCDAGYSGERCEINLCQGYCLNNGECSLSEEDEPFCQCVGDYEGSKCEALKNDSTTSTCTLYSEEKNLTLADIFSNFRKSFSKMTITVEN